MITKTDIQVLDLGQVAYERALEVQKTLVDDIAAGRAPSTLIMCEHPPVITYGRLAKKSNILATESELEEAGVQVCFADRGGDVTFHGPGQVVFYPLINLRHYGKDLHRYIRSLEEAVICVLRDNFTLNAYRHEGVTGVWVGPYKIASIGIGVRNWVTYHGLSLNVKTDARFFSMIRSCGMDAPMASLSSFFRDELIVVKKVKEAVKESLISHFSRREDR